MTRLIAFGEARLDLLAEHADVLTAAEAGPGRLLSAPYAVSRLHITLLLRDADPGCDSEYLAESLLAALGVDLFLYMRDVRGLSLQRLKDGWGELARRTVPDAPGSSL
jgi:hypothetical protein